MAAVVRLPGRVTVPYGRQTISTAWTPELLRPVAGTAAEWTGRAWAFAIAVLVLLTWAISGPIFSFSDTWQLIINTGTTIVTFLMVFLIQHSENRNSQALQMKLDELISATKSASNRLIDIENLNDHELKALHRKFARLAETATLSSLRPTATGIETSRRTVKRSLLPQVRSANHRTARVLGDVDAGLHPSKAPRRLWNRRVGRNVVRRMSER